MRRSQRKKRRAEDTESTWHAQLIWTFVVAIAVALVALQSPGSKPGPRHEWLSQKSDEGPSRFLSTSSALGTSGDRAEP